MSIKQARIPFAGPSATAQLLAIAIDIVASPAAAIDRIVQRRRTLAWPLLAMAIVTAALWGAYFAHVDFTWFTQRQAMVIAASGSGMESATVRESFAQMGSGLFTLTTTVSTLTVALAVVLARAFGLHLAARLFSQRENRYGDWLAVSAWATLPGTLFSAVSLLLFISHGAQRTPPEDLNLLSLNTLLLQLPGQHAWAGIASAVDLAGAWSVVFLGIAFARLAGGGTARGIALVALPVVGALSLWALAVAS